MRKQFLSSFCVASGIRWTLHETYSAVHVIITFVPIIQGYVPTGLIGAYVSWLLQGAG